MEYNYPLDIEWSTEEMVDVVRFFEQVERAYESSTTKEEFLRAYRAFKRVVPSKAEEKTILKQFEKASTYSAYHAIQLARTSERSRIAMNRSDV